MNHNPHPGVYMRITDKARTIDEHPLRQADLKTTREKSPGREVKMLWLTTLQKAAHLTGRPSVNLQTAE